MLGPLICYNCTRVYTVITFEIFIIFLAHAACTIYTLLIYSDEREGPIRTCAVKYTSIHYPERRTMHVVCAHSLSHNSIVVEKIHLRSSRSAEKMSLKNGIRKSLSQLSRCCTISFSLSLLSFSSKSALAHYRKTIVIPARRSTGFAPSSNYGRK